MCQRNRTAFSLTELVVVIGIIGVLVGLLLPAVQRIRESANRVRCTSNLRQIGLAIQSYHNRLGHFPPSRDGKFQDPHGASWSWLILADLGEEHLIGKWNYTVAFHEENSTSREAVATPVSIYFCPSRPGPTVSTPINAPNQRGALNDYAACAGTMGDDVMFFPPNKSLLPPNGVFQHAGIEPHLYSLLNINKKIKFEHVTDGLSQTVLIGEKYVKGGKRTDQDTDQAYRGEQSVGWGLYPPVLGASTRCLGSPPFFFPIVGPESLKFFEAAAVEPGGFGSEHPGICQFVFCDGHVESIRNTTDVVILGLLSRRNDGLAIPDY